MLYVVAVVMDVVCCGCGDEYCMLWLWWWMLYVVAVVMNVVCCGCGDGCCMLWLW